jgi:KDO2-lipid IV(A) lauroyltransferase
MNNYQTGPLLKRVKNTFIYLSIRFLVPLVKLLPRAVSLGMASMFSRSVYWLARSERKKMETHLGYAFSKAYGQAEVRTIGKRVFKNIAHNLVDAVLMKKLLIKNPSKYMSIENLDIATKALKDKKGIIFLTAHLGCFEMLPARFSLLGFPMIVTGARVYDPRINRLIVEHRSIFKITYIQRDQDVRQVIQGLRAGKALGVLCDLDTRIESRFINFFNRPAKTPMGPFRLGVKMNVPMIPIFTVRQENGTQQVTLYPPIAPNGKNFDEKVGSVMVAYNNLLETIIRKDPAQWIWMHERWKSKPSR